MAKNVANRNPATPVAAKAQTSEVTVLITQTEKHTQRIKVPGFETQKTVVVTETVAFSLNLQKAPKPAEATSTVSKKARVTASPGRLKPDNA